MPFFRRIRAPWRAATICLMAGLVGGCATRYRAALAPMAPVAATIIWRIEAGDVLQTKVFRNPELNGEATVGSNGAAFFPGVGRIDVAGMTRDSLESLLNIRYASFIRDVAVQVSQQRDITLYGQVRAPGVYAIEPGLTIIGLLARAGGLASSTSGSSGSASLTLQTADGRRLALPAEARLGTIDIRRSDAVLVTDDSFFIRNSPTIGAASLVVTTLSTLLSVILLISR